jgi:uncharacterized protein YecE (DUF72 family)
MRFLVGTSGYSYKEWKGSFYPADMSEAGMLPYYAQHFPAVELNNTFYRMPTTSAAESWAKLAPPAFQFALKAPQTITHRKRLNNAAKEAANFLKVASVLKERQGPLLFQLPPNFKKDLDRLEKFLKSVAKSARVAFEFRHESWFDDSVFDCLRANSCALCVADIDDGPEPRVLATAKWGYVRLRKENYTDAKLRDWAKRLKELEWADGFVFFRHEDTGKGPKFAKRFLEFAGS